MIVLVALALAVCMTASAVEVREEVLPFGGGDGHHRYAASGAALGYDEQGHPRLGKVAAGKRVGLKYAARWGVRPVRGAERFEAAVLGGSGQAELVLSPLGSKERLSFKGEWKEGKAVFATNLPRTERYAFVGLDLIADATPAETVCVGSLCAVRDVPEAEAFRVDVETGTAYHALTGRARPVFLVRNLATDERSLGGTLKLRDFFGEGFDLPLSGSVPAGRVLRVPCDRELPGKGLWRVSAEFRGRDGSAATETTTFALLDEHPVTPPLEDGTFRMGTVCHIEGYAPHDRGVCYDALAAMGAKIVRCNLCMMGLMQAKGPDAFDCVLQDEVIDAFRAHGIAVNTLLTWAPRWSFSEAHKKVCDAKYGIGPITPEPAPFRAFCEKLARRYGTRIAWYESSNEVDLRPAECGTTEELIAFQKACWEGVKAGCPKAKVLTPGFGPFTSESRQVTQKGCQEDLCDKARDWYDAHAVHAHGGFMFFADGLNRFLAWRRARGLGSKPWFPNETALTTALGQEDAAAEAVWKKILLCRANGAVDYVWYNLRAKGWDADDGEAGYGMLTADYHPRAPYAAFSALTALIGGAWDTVRYPSFVNRFLFRLRPDRNGRDMVLVGWDEDAVDAPCRVSVRTDAASAWSVDLMGNRRRLAVQNGVCELALAKRPLGIVLKGATYAEADAAQLTAQPTPLATRVRFDPKPVDKQTKPAFVLNRKDQIHDVYEANPVYAHRLWKGTNDLSAAVWVGRGVVGRFAQPSAVEIRIDVRDDVAHAEPTRLTEGDAVQVVLNFPEQQGAWMFTAARRDDGAARLEVSVAPEGVDRATAARDAQLSVRRDGSVTSYRLALPFSLLRVGWDSTLVNPFGFNVRVYDNDGEGADGWIAWHPALNERPLPATYPRVGFNGRWQIKP